ncbi:MAG: PBP1A family penicillin-binding protein [Oscillospiraceae bacterium]|nr:PBP1A family penicillin-binding protein [Oscillospiraceae bacterium]
MFFRKTQRVVSGVFRIGGTALSWFSRILGTVLLILAMTVLFLALIFTLYIKYDLQPGLELELTDIDLAESSQIVYVDKLTGEEIEMQTIYSEENRIWVKYDQLNPYLIDAAISIEDQRFERHQGVDWHRTAGAFVTMFLSMSNSFGGSTITQQLIKNLTKDDDVTVQRKLTEIFKAIEFERRYTKNTIMEWYLNTIYFGEQCNGAETAALKYFGKDVWDLTLAECASLIGITNNPSLYDPYISEKTREANKARQEDVLWAMLEVGKIDRAEYDEAMAQTLVFTSKEAEYDESRVYSWFEDQVVYEVTQDLADHLGVTYKAASLLLSTGGYTIYATIDPEIQAIVDEVYSDVSNLPGYTSIYNQQLQSAIAIVEPSTGNIVAIAGGVGEKTQSLIWNRATQTTRSPGSSIKPITVYAPAIEEGLITPATVYDDTPLEFNSPDAANGLYPKNQNNSYRGLTTVKYAVQASLNTVAVKVVNDITPEVSYRYATEKFGLTTLVESRVTESGYTFSDIGLSSMALGGLTDGISVAELSAAYATFANDGYYNAPRTYTHVVNSKGETVLDNSAAAVEALSQRTTYYMNQLLVNVVQNGTGTRAKLDNMTVAGKTGTTSDDHDRWFVGYTPYYSAAVWVGFDTPEEVNVDSSTNPALAMWRLVMERVHAELEFKDFSSELETQTAAVCLQRHACHQRLQSRHKRQQSGIKRVYKG